MIYRFALLLFIFAALSSCKSKPPREFRVGISPWPAYEYLYLAQVKGFVEEEKVNLKLVEFSSLGDAKRAYQRGQIDALLSTFIELLQIREESSLRPQAVFALDESAGADVMVARDPIKSPRDLKGKTVGVEVASLGIFMLARALEKAGMSLDDVTVKALDQAAMSDQLKAGAVDAIVTYPPVSVKTLALPGMNRIFGSDEIPGEVVDILSLEPREIDNRRAEITGLIRAFDRAILYAQQNPEEAHSIMGSREQLSAAEFQGALEGVRVLRPCQQGLLFALGGSLQRALEGVESVMRTQQGLKKSGLAENALVPDFVSVLAECS